jgi:uncharacterized protein YqeY
MSLKAELTQTMKEAMKAKDTVRLTTVRMVLSAIKNKEIEAGGELDDAAITAVLSTLAKQRRESAEAFRDGARTELAEQEEAELVVIQSFLPEPLSEAEIDELIEKAIAETGAASMKDMGKVMKLVSAQTTGRADGRVVSERVKARLSS